MRTVITGVLALAVGLLGGAWSARGEIGDLRDQTDRLRRERDRAKKAKTAADLAMIARLGQAERDCPPCEETRPPRTEPPALAPRPAPAPPPAPTAEGPQAPLPDGSPPRKPRRGEGFMPPEDRREALDEFAEDVGMSEGQLAEVEKLGTDFQRELEEVLGGAIARFAFDEATGREPRPRDVATTADSLLHTYLDADDRFRDLLDEDQLELLDDSEFDVLWLIDFDSLGQMAERTAKGARP